MIYTKTLWKIFIALTCLGIFSVSAEDEILLEDIEIEYPENVYIENLYTVNLESLRDDLVTRYPGWSFNFEWDIFWESPRTGSKLEVNFETSGRKQILLSIYNTVEGEKNLLYSSSFFPFIYQYSVPLVQSNQISKEMSQDFFAAAEDLGIYLYELGIYPEQNILGQDILEAKKNLSEDFYWVSNYTILWWEKEFLFSTLSELQLLWQKNTPENFVLISSFNTKILQNYISNSIAWKNLIWDGFIIDEAYRNQILKNPRTISELMLGLEQNNYQYIPLVSNIEISPLLFISRFINELSKFWVTNSDIYIILLLPFFLTLVAFSKHIIWFSTLGNVIPVFMWILLIKIWVVFTIAIIWFIVIFNLILSRFVSKYTLLYTPKITFITIMNLVVFMLMFSLFWYISVLELPNLTNILYIILFFIIAEKLISIMSTKEFREYRKSLWWTLIVSFLCFWLYNVNYILVFLLAYPEIILLLVPVNFFLGRFTGLRITEYIRFKDISKNIEE